MVKGPLAQAAWDEFSEEEKAEILQVTEQKIQAYDNLQAVRKAAGLTQAKIAQELHMPQGNISRLEHGSDMLLSTLQRYVKAAGGTLHLTVELPGQPPIPLNSLGDLIETQDVSEHPQL